MKDKINEISKYIFIFVTGALFSLLICQIPKIRYDINNDGKVTMADAVKIVNYYIEKRDVNENN